MFRCKGRYSSFQGELIVRVSIRTIRLPSLILYLDLNVFDILVLDSALEIVIISLKALILNLTFMPRFNQMTQLAFPRVIHLLTRQMIVPDLTAIPCQILIFILTLILLEPIRSILTLFFRRTPCFAPIIILNLFVRDQLYIPEAEVSSVVSSVQTLILLSTPICL